MAYAEIGVDREGVGWEHVERCEDCALLYFQHAWIAVRMRNRSEPRVGRFAKLPRFHRGLAAAALLLALSVVAVAIHLNRPRLTGTGDQAFATAGEMERSLGLLFSELAFSPDASTLDHAPFVGPDGGAATVVAVDVGRREGVDFAAFDASGAPLWRASKRWGARWESVLGVPGVTYWKMTTLVTKSSRAGLEETLYVAVYRGDRSALLAIDPRAGELLGEVFLDGRIIPIKSLLHGLVALPAPHGQQRRVLCAVQTGAEFAARPGLLLLERDCTPVQQVRLPVIEEERNIPIRHALSCEIDWGRDPPLVVAHTSEWLHVLLEYVDGRLDTAATRVTRTDNVKANYDEEHGSGSFLGPHPNEGAKLAALRQAVQEVEVDLPAGWGHE